MPSTFTRLQGWSVQSKSINMNERQFVSGCSQILGVAHLPVCSLCLLSAKLHSTWLMFKGGGLTQDVRAGYPSNLHLEGNNEDAL